VDEKKQRWTCKTDFVPLFPQFERLLYVECVRVYDYFEAMVDVKVLVDFFGAGGVYEWIAGILAVAFALVGFTMKS